MKERAVFAKLNRVLIVLLMRVTHSPPASCARHPALQSSTWDTPVQESSSASLLAATVLMSELPMSTPHESSTTQKTSLGKLLTMSSSTKFPESPTPSVSELSTLDASEPSKLSLHESSLTTKLSPPEPSDLPLFASSELPRLPSDLSPKHAATTPCSGSSYARRDSSSEALEEWQEPKSLALSITQSHLSSKKTQIDFLLTSSNQPPKSESDSLSRIQAKPSSATTTTESIATTPPSNRPSTSSETTPVPRLIPEISPSTFGYTGVKDRRVTDISYSPFSFSGGSSVAVGEFWRQVAEAYYDYCGNACNSSGLSRAPHAYHACEPCYCDQACLNYTDCCPDVYARLGDQPYDLLEAGIRCSRASFGLPSSPKYVMVTRCPENTDPMLRSKCQTDLTSHWNLTQPVSDAESFVTYKNRYCAQCHSVSNLTLWQAGVSVRAPPMVQDITSAAELYRSVLRDSFNQIVYDVPASLISHERKCRDDPVVSVCNTTGTWRHHDEAVELACFFLTAPIVDWMTTYKNPFCYLCNTYRSWTEILRTLLPPTTNTDDGPLPLLMLLDFSDSHDGDQHVQDEELPPMLNQPSVLCSSDEFVDTYTNSCRSIDCAQGKLAQKRDGVITACQSFPRTANLYGYAICLHEKTFPPEELLSYETFYPDYYAAARDFHSMLFSEKLVYSFLYKGAESKLEVLSHYLFEMFVTEPVDRDEHEAALLSNQTSIVDSFRALLNRSELQLSPTCSAFDLLSLVTSSSSDTLLEYTEPASVEREHYVIAERAVYLPLAGYLNCPFVILGRDEFDFDFDANEMIISDGEASNGSSRIGVPLFHFNDRLEAMVCLHEYKKVHMKKDAAMDIHKTSDDLQRKEAPSKYERPLYWVSFLSIIISLFFLFISFLIYCLLSSLRTVAGINNLILIVALFAAQLLLQIVADVSMADWLCQVVGVATHFFWLVVTFAQNACTFHMFYTLSFPLRSVVTMANPALLTKKYAFYVIFMSAGFVTATLAWQFGVDGRSGYGGSSCYITKPMVRILMFAAPLAATVLINFAMFVITIVRLRTQQHVESTRSNRINLVQYTKLSVFTGLTWLLGFLAAFLKSEVMQYVFAVCQGGQGLFVFLAFLANGRVLAMLKERFGCTLKKEETAGKRTTVDSRKTTDATTSSQNATHETPAASSEVVFLNNVAWRRSTDKIGNL